MNNRQVDDNLRICKALVADNFNAHVATKGKHAPVTLEDVYVVTYSYAVTYSYTLGNFKAIVATTRKDNLYYEVTYDVVKNRAYIDVYKKCANRVTSDRKINHILERTEAPETNQNIQEDEA